METIYPRWGNLNCADTKMCVNTTSHYISRVFINSVAKPKSFERRDVNTLTDDAIDRFLIRPTSAINISTTCNTILYDPRSDLPRDINSYLDGNGVIVIKTS